MPQICEHLGPNLGTSTFYGIQWYLTIPVWQCNPCTKPFFLRTYSRAGCEGPCLTCTNPWPPPHPTPVGRAWLWARHDLSTSALDLTVALVAEWEQIPAGVIQTLMVSPVWVQPVVAACSQRMLMVAEWKQWCNVQVSAMHLYTCVFFVFNYNRKDENDFYFHCRPSFHRFLLICKHVCCSFRFSINSFEKPSFSLQ